jgi:hypothetical protein
VPEIVGGELFAAGALEACTTAVAEEKALVFPAELVAVTRTLIVNPTSAVATAYVEFVAPLIGLQSIPDGSQCCHW